MTGAAVDDAVDDAVGWAVRSLEHRDRTELELLTLLRARGFSDPECAHALETLRRTGLVDDARFALARATSLAGRGAGNALIRVRLAGAGVAVDDTDAAIAGLESEAARARRIVSKRGASGRTARYLCAKGFAEDVVAAAIADGVEGELG